MALQFSGPVAFTDADKLPPGSCAWNDWDSSRGAPPGEVYFDVNAANGGMPNPASIRVDLADETRFYLFRFNYLIEGVPFVSTPMHWIPSAPSQPAGSSGEPTTAAVTDPLIRQLMCRGGPSGLEFSVIADPSPAYPDPPKQVRIALRYNVHLASDTAELALSSMSPGSCGWDMQFGSPKPPGEVIIDIETDAQASNVSLGLPRDTSVRAGLSYPDTASLRRYLSDPRHFWVFFHMDPGEPLAISHAAYEPDLTNLLGPVGEASTTASGTATGARDGAGGSFGGTLRGGTASGATTDRTTTSDATALFRAAELRCRGGAALEFVRGGSAGDNQVLMTLAYPVSPGVPGETGRGLAAGSCAWADRTDLPGEPGRVTFVTAGNAQLRQVQSGSAVDRSPTAAERWPDAHTIPAYMADPERYWRFTVLMRNADSAQQHGPWKPSIADAIAGPVSEASPDRTVPETSAGVEGAVDSVRSSAAFDPFAVRGIVVTSDMTSVQMSFEGPSVIPLVQVSTSAPFQEPSTGRWIFPPGAVALSVIRDPSGGNNAYFAKNTAPLLRGTPYHYIIGAPKPVSPGTLNRRRREGGDRQAIGTFRTLRTDVTVRIDRIRIIDDSDDGSNGDLAFSFSLNGRRELEIGTSLAQVSNGSVLDLEDGETYDVSRDIRELGAGDRLRIHAAGFDDDDGFVDSGEFDAGWDATPGGDGGGDWNHARAEYHLDRYPGTSFDFPLRLRTGPGSKLQFEVEGRVSVTRE